MLALSEVVGHVDFLEAGGEVTRRQVLPRHFVLRDPGSGGPSRRLLRVRPVAVLPPPAGPWRVRSATASGNSPPPPGSPPRRPGPVRSRPPRERRRRGWRQRSAPGRGRRCGGKCRSGPRPPRSPPPPADTTGRGRRRSGRPVGKEGEDDPKVQPQRHHRLVAGGAR